MNDPLFFSAWLAAAGVALMAGPLGCFVVWRRMAYLGDMVAHASLLGVVLALALDIHTGLGVTMVAMAAAGLLALPGRTSILPTDTLIGILAHGALALGLVLVALLDIRVDINAYLFGDVLAVSGQDTFVIYALALPILGALAWLWRPLLMSSIHSGIAEVEGVNTRRMRLALTLMIALAIAVSIKIVGMLLMTSLLIIPAAAVRGFVRTPGRMCIMAGTCALMGVTLGLALAFTADLPSGPSIILATLALFLAAQPFRQTA